MKPRIFVSSTYYDLKYIRNNLSSFIKQYGFDSVLFESGDITFKHNTALDKACYAEVKLCHMMILIIGGRYGSKISENDNKKDINCKAYENEYVSITKQEFQTAIENNIPVYVFIDKNVYAEYETFRMNEENEELISKIKFAHVDNISIFKFIDYISKLRYQAISQFEKIEDITNYLQMQWSGLFYTYLTELQSKSKDNKLLNSVLEIQNLSKNMEKMIDKLAETSLEDKDYKELIAGQQKDLILFFIQQLRNGIRIYSTDRAQCREIAEIIYKDILENDKLNVDNVMGMPSEELIKQLKKSIKNMATVDIEKVETSNLIIVISNYDKKIKKIFVENPELKEHFLTELSEIIYCPF